MFNVKRGTFPGVISSIMHVREVLTDRAAAVMFVEMMVSMVQ